MSARALGLAACALLAACSSGSEAPDGAATLAPAVSDAASSLPAPSVLDGRWLPDAPGDVLTVVGDAPLPTPLGRRLAAAHRSGANADPRGWDDTRRCLPPGVPRLMSLAQPLKIHADPQLVVFIFEYQRLVRFVPLDDTYPQAREPAFLGQSHGHWEGDTLVIETTAFKPGLVYDGAGLPQGSAAHVTERLERVDDDTLVDHVAIDDAQMYQHPWQAEIRLRRQSDAPLGEDVCVERTELQP